MDTINNYLSEHPVDESTLRDVGDPTEHNRLKNELYRGAYRDGGFVSPTIGVTVEDTMLDLPNAEYSEMLDNEVYSKIGPSAFDVEAGDYNRQRFDFITSHRVFSSTVQKDAIGRSAIGYEFNLDNAENFALAAGVLGKTPTQMQALMDGKEGISSRESRALYEAQVAQADKMISELTDGAPLRGLQRQALTSLVMHNPALLGPNLVKYIKNGDVKKAITEIRDKSNGSKNKALSLRRKQEAMHFAGYRPDDVITDTTESRYAAYFGMPKPRKVTAPETSLRPQLRPNQGAKVEGGGVKTSLRPRLRPKAEVDQSVESPLKPKAEVDQGVSSSLRPRMRPDDLPVPASAGGVSSSLRPRMRPQSVGTKVLIDEISEILGPQDSQVVEPVNDNITPVVIPDDDGEITVTSLGNSDVNQELVSEVEGALSETTNLTADAADILADLDVDTDSAMFFDTASEYAAARDSGQLVEGDEIVIGTDGNLSTFMHTDARNLNQLPVDQQPDTPPDLTGEGVKTTDGTTLLDEFKAGVATFSEGVKADINELKADVAAAFPDAENIQSSGTITDTSQEEISVVISTKGEVFNADGELMDATVDDDGSVLNGLGEIIGEYAKTAASVAVGGATVVAGGIALATIAAYQGVKGIAEVTVDLAKKINTMGGLALSTPGRLLIGDIVQPDFFKKNVITINENYLADDEMGVLQDFVKKHGTGKINYSDYKGAGSVDVRGKNSPTLSDMSGLSAVERLQKSFGESMIKVIDGDYYLIDQYDFNVFVDYSDTNSSGKGKVYNAEAYDKKFGGLGVADALSLTMGSDRTLFDKLHNLAFIMGSRDYEGTNRDVGRQVRIKIGPVDNRVASK